MSAMIIDSGWACTTSSKMSQTAAPAVASPWFRVTAFHGLRSPPMQLSFSSSRSDFFDLKKGAAHCKVSRRDLPRQAQCSRTSVLP